MFSNILIVLKRQGILYTNSKSLLACIVNHCDRHITSFMRNPHSLVAVLNYIGLAIFTLIILSFLSPLKSLSAEHSEYLFLMDHYIHSQHRSRAALHLAFPVENYLM